MLWNMKAKKQIKNNEEQALWEKGAKTLSSHFLNQLGSTSRRNSSWHHALFLLISYQNCLLVQQLIR